MWHAHAVSLKTLSKVCICTYVYIHTYVHMYMCVHVCTCVYIHTCAHVVLYVKVTVCMYVLCTLQWLHYCSRLADTACLHTRVSPRHAFPSRSSRYPGSHSQRKESSVSTQVWLHPPLLVLHSSVVEGGEEKEGV